MGQVTGLTGFSDVSIGIETYVVDSVDIGSQEARVIERSDGNGDASDFEVRAASEHITGTIVLQRATSSQAFPSRGANFDYDYDNRGTLSTLKVTNVSTNRSKDEMLTFEVGILVVDRPES